jgi:hypothetical protein
VGAIIFINLQSYIKRLHCRILPAPVPKPAALKPVPVAPVPKPAIPVPLALAPSPATTNQFLLE